MYCEEARIDSNDSVPVALFAVKASVHKFKGFSPFELVYRHKMRVFLKMMKEKQLGGDHSLSVVKYVSD